MEPATTTVTQPWLEVGAALLRPIAQPAPASTITSTPAITRFWARVSGTASRWEWPIITISGRV